MTDLVTLIAGGVLAAILLFFAATFLRSGFEHLFGGGSDE